MNIKKEYIVLGIIIICLSLYLIFQQTDSTRYRLPDLPKITDKEISKIQLTASSGSTIVLNRSESGWKIEPEDYMADAGKVERMLDIIGDLTLTAMVSESENFGRYDLGDDKKIIVSAWAKDNLIRSFDIGKAASTFRHTFIKVKGDSRVYHARENFRSTFDTTIEKLRDKTVLSFEEAEIQSIAVTQKGKTVSLSKAQVPVEVTADADKNKDKKEDAGGVDTQPVWQDADGNRIDKAKVDKLLSSLSALTCESYIEGKQKADYERMEPLYTVKLKGPEDYSLTVFAKEADEATAYPAISSQNLYPFTLAGFRANKIMKGLDDADK